MESLDAKVFGLIAFATFFVVEAAKFFFPKAVSGKEAQIAALLPILFTIGAKAAGWFHETPWEDAILWAIGGGAASGAGHDKVYDPVKKMVLGLFKKPPAADTSSAPSSNESSK